MDRLESETARRLVQLLIEKAQSVVLAESCTGGLVAALLTAVPGSSQALWGSFVVYTPEAKSAMLGIAPQLLSTYGLVSRETACAMATGALERSGATAAAAITGLAGPLGDGSAVPVGRVWVAVALRGGQVDAQSFDFAGGREEVRFQAANTALEELYKALDKSE